jgi:hypothetical protein
MGRDKGAAMTSLSCREVRRWLERQGYRPAAGQHKHLKLVQPGKPMVMLPLQPQTSLSLSAARQISHALGFTNVQELIHAIKSTPPHTARQASTN